MAGKCYIFNTMQSEINTLMINNKPFTAGSPVPGYSDGTALYTPGTNGKSGAVNRSIYPSQNEIVLANGVKNTIIVTTPNFSKNGVIEVPTPEHGLSIEDDIILYITSNYMILMNTAGLIFTQANGGVDGIQPLVG